MNSYPHQHFVGFLACECVNFTGLSNRDDVNKNFGFVSNNTAADVLAIHKNMHQNEWRKVINTATRRRFQLNYLAKLDDLLIWKVNIGSVCIRRVSERQLVCAIEVSKFR